MTRESEPTTLAGRSASSSMAIPQTTAHKHKAKRHRHRKHRHVWNDKHWRWVPDRRWRLARPGLHLSSQTQAAQAPLPRPGAEAGPGGSSACRAAQTRDPRPAGAYQGAVRPHDQAVRLLDRAGSGPRPARKRSWPAGPENRRRPVADPPSGSADPRGHAAGRRGRTPIAPADATGHDHLWWLDRMVRSNQSLVERMALVFTTGSRRTGMAFPSSATASTSRTCSGRAGPARSWACSNR